MRAFFILLLTFNIVFSVAYTISCQSCKHFIPHSRGIHDLGLCEIFKGNFAQHCRNDKNLCGEKGILYEEDERFSKEVSNIYDELNNRCSGEVNEKEELEQLEKDFAEIYEKIKKYNKNIRRPFYSGK
jgi:flagellar motility protein MotE (MotC chaperone)